MKLTPDEKQRIHQEFNARLNARSRFSSASPNETTDEPIIHQPKSRRSLNLIVVAATLAVGLFGFLAINHMGEPLIKRRLMSVFPANTHWQPLFPKVFADDKHLSISNHDAFDYQNTIIELHTQSFLAHTYRLAIGTLAAGATQRYQIVDFVDGTGSHFKPGPKDRLSIRVICDTSKGDQTGTWTNE